MLQKLLNDSHFELDLKKNNKNFTVPLLRYHSKQDGKTVRVLHTQYASMVQCQ